jgi:hypothetical protein
MTIRLTRRLIASANCPPVGEELGDEAADAWPQGPMVVLE